MKKYVLFLLLALPAFVQARVIANIEFPEKIVIEVGKEVHLQGVAIRKKVFTDVYAAGFYVNGKVSTAHEALESHGPKEMRIVFIYKSISSQKFIKGWKEGIEKNNSKTELVGQADNIGLFYKSIKDDMLAGDKLVIQQSKSGKTKLIKNSQLLLSIEDKGFYNILLSAWMGDSPPSGSFQKSILGA
ncbi:MAG: hypothetical protein HON32_04330 [Francisellaceae bacterium]|jgi:hypothetical protein|nr:hypothetical protein [Francisellaceae bacterium]MBT6539805.1 hypothetical protein [Francisellaceae bacterium]